MSVRTAIKTRTGVPIVNLLPPEYAEQEHLRRLQYKLLGGVVLAVVVLFGMYLNGREGVASARSQLDAARATQTTLAAEKAQYADVPATRARLQSAEATLATAMTNEIRWSSYLRDVSLSVPKNVWLTDLTGSVSDGTTPEAADPAAGAADPGLGTVTFLGRALEYDDVADWLDALEKQRGYTNAWSSDLKTVIIAGKKYVDFTSSVTLTEEAVYNPNEAKQ